MADVVIAEDGHRIRIELAHLKQTRSIVAAMTLDDIRILDGGIQVAASLK